MKKKVRKFVRKVLCPYYLAAAVLSVLIIVLVCQTAAYSKTGKAQAVPLSSAMTLQRTGNIVNSIPLSQPVKFVKDAAFSALADIAEELESDDIADNPVDIDRQEPAKWKTVRMRVTGYCPCSKCCGYFSDGKTANMHTIKWGDRFVAAPKGYKFGTEMIIPGYNSSEAVMVYDRGRLIKGNKLDVFFNTHYSASKWGVKYLDVKIKIK